MKPNQPVEFLNTEGKRDFAKVAGSSGKVYSKQIIKFGDYVDPWFPEWPMTLDSEWGDAIVSNFVKGVVGRVPVPASHTDDPEKNRGELIALENDGEGLNGQLDIRDPEMVDRIENNLVWDDSIRFTNNYVDEKGIGHGPVLFHVALVNNPYITGMSGFQALSRVISDIRFSFSKTHNGSAIVLSKQVKEFNKMLKTIKNDKEFPVTVKYQDADGKDQEVAIEAGKEIEVPEATAEGVTQQIADAKAPEAAPEETADEKAAREQKETEDANVAAGKNPDGSEKTEANPAAATNTPAEGAEAAANPGNEASALSKAEREELEALRASKGETMFSKLLAEGKVVPAQKEEVLSLAKTAGAEAVEKMFSKAVKVIDFSEQGSQNSGKDTPSGEGADKDLNKNVKQWSDLSEAEQANLKTLNVSEKEYNETALANPQHYQKPVSK